MAETEAVSIGALRTRDAGALGAMFEANDVPEVTRHFHPFKLSRQTAARLANRPGRDRFYVARAGDRIVGFGMLRGWEEGYEIPSLGVLVDRGYQGAGLGRRMTEFLVGEAAALAPAVRLTVHADNQRAMGLYRSLGFRVTGQQPGPPCTGRCVMTREFKSDG